MVHPVRIFGLQNTSQLSADHTIQVLGPIDVSVSRGRSGKEKEKVPALGTEWEVIDAVMIQSSDSPTSPAAPKAWISPTSPSIKKGSSVQAQQSSTFASGSGSQWRREEKERPSVNGTSGGRQESYPSSRQDENNSRHGNYSALRPDGYPPRHESFIPNRSPSHSRTGSGEIRDVREREGVREPNKILRRSPTAPASAAPVKSSSPLPVQEKVRGPEKLVKNRSRRDRERELEREREKEESSRRTSQPAPSGSSKLRSRTTDTRAEHDSSKSILHSNPSTRRARPTSEVTVEPIEQLKAQGAWDAKLLGMRGQSVVIPDKFSVAPPPSQAQGQYQPPASSLPPQYSQSQQHHTGHLPRASAGTSHTQFVMQPPFQQQQPSRLGAYPAYQPRQYAYYPVQQRQTQDPNPLPAPPAQINYPPQRVNR